MEFNRGIGRVGIVIQFQIFVLLNIKFGIDRIKSMNGVFDFFMPKW